MTAKAAQDLIHTTIDFPLAAVSYLLSSLPPHAFKQETGQTAAAQVSLTGAVIASRLIDGRLGLAGA